MHPSVEPMSNRVLVASAGHPYHNGADGCCAPYWQIGGLMDILRQVDRVARKLSKRRCCCCSLRIHAGDAYVEQAIASSGHVYTTVAHDQCFGEYERGEWYDFGWLASDPSMGSEAWQRWYHSRAGMGDLVRDLAFLFAQRVHVAMARGATPSALGDLAAVYLPRRAAT